MTAFLGKIDNETLVKSKLKEEELQEKLNLEKSIGVNNSTLKIGNSNGCDKTVMVRNIFVSLI